MNRDKEFRIEGAHLMELEKLAGNFSDRVAFFRLHGMAISALEAGFSIDVALKQMQLLTGVCLVYPTEDRLGVLKIIEVEYIGALESPVSRLHTDANKGRRNPIWELHNRIWCHYQTHHVNLRLDVLLNSVKECFYDSRELVGYPRFPGKRLNRKGQIQPEPPPYS